MQRALKLMLSLVGSMLFLCGGFVVLRGSIPPALINAWLPAGNLTAARSSSSSVLLQDGRLLVTGGTDASGPLASTDILDTSGNFTPGPPMNFARSNHVAVTLLDGKVLVAGGTGADGRPTDTAEIFDPLANTWTMAGLLLVPRSGATATLLPDGRVLIAAGVSSGGATNTLEIYDPASGNFTAAAGVLSSARQNQAAALLPNGKVLIVGGSDGTQALATSDIFDPANGAVSPGPVLQTARSGLTATTLLDGTVLVAGGTTTAQDGSSQDLASLEVLSPGGSGFTLAPASLTTPRSGQAAFLLPHNNSVLFVGGTSNGTVLNSSELYLPWAGAFSAPATLASPRNLLTGSPLATDGMLLVAGGSDGTNIQATTEVYGFATVRTDKADYAPGEIVTITGSGWQPGETVTLSLVELPLIDTPTPVTAVADANGNIINTQFSPDQYDIGVRFYLTAMGNVSQAQTMFTDNKSVTVSFASTGSGSVTSNPAGINCTDTGGTSSGTCSVSVGNTAQVTLTAAATSPSTIGAWTVPSGYSIDSGCTSGNTSCVFTLNNTSQTVAVAFNAGAAAEYVVTSSNNSPAAGAGVTITAQLADSGGNPVHTSGKIVTWSKTGSGGSFGSATSTTNANGVASVTFTTGTVAGTVYTVTATDNTAVTGNSSNITTVAGTFSQLVFGQQPTNTVAGQTITPAVTVIEQDANGNTIASDNGTHITISILSNPSAGTLSGTTNVAVSGGIATFSSLSINNTGNGYTLQAHGPSNITETSSSFNITSSSVNTNTTVASSANPSVFGQNVTFTASVAPASGSVAPTGNVQFVVDGSNYGAPVALGTCSPPATATACASISDSALSVSNHTVTANYLGDTGFNTSSGSLAGGQTVNKADTTTTVGTITPEPSLVGQSYSVAYTVAATSPGSGTPTGNVTVDDGNGNQCTGTVAAGSCSLTSTSIGTKTITATYAGDTDFNGSHGTASHVVSKRPTSTTVTSISPGSVPLGVGATVAVTVTDTGTGTTSNPSGTIALTTSGSGTFGTCTLAPSGADAATCTASYTPSGTISGTSRTDTVTASFTAGDGTHQDSSDTTGKTLTVTKRSTSTTVTSLSPTSVVVAQATTVTVTVTDTESGTASNPGGTVSLATTGTGTFGTCTLSPSGADAATCTASYTPSDAVTSPQTITASFTATDSVHKDSADNTGKSLTVTRRSTSTGVVLTPASVVTGQSSSVAVTITDTESAGTKQYPTGTITIGSSEATDVFTGTCTLASTVTAGVSTCSVSVKPVHVATSPHSITATFSQTGVHFGSSNSADLTVSKANTSITSVAASPEPSVLGASYSVSWVLSVVSPGSGTPTGTVNVSDGHGNTCSATAPANTCTITTSTVAGPLTLTVTYLGDSDFNGTTGSGTHTISFNFLGLFDPYAPPPRGYKVKSAVPLIWQYADVNGVVVNSSNANPVVQIYVAGACGGTDTGDILDIQASGNSGYQYDSTTNTWQFNWKTTGMSAGCYNIYIKSTLTGQINGPFPIQLVR